MQHIGNNVWLIRSKQGDTRDDIPISQNNVIIDIDTGKISSYSNNAYNDVSFGSKSDQLFASITRQISLTNIGTSYVNVFPAFYDGFPIPIDTTGYENLGVIVLWNKNGGTGRHDLRLVNNANEAEVLVHTEGLTTDNGGDPTTGGIKSGRTVNYGISIPQAFENFRGELRIQAKSDVGTDDPVFDGLLIYLIR